MFLIFHNYNWFCVRSPFRKLIRQFRYAHCHLLCKEKARKITSLRVKRSNPEDWSMHDRTAAPPSNAGIATLRPRCRTKLFGVAVAVGVLRLPVKSVATHVVERLFGFEPD